MGLARPAGVVVELDQEGNVDRWLYDADGEVINSVSEVMQAGKSLYLASQANPFIGLVEMSM